MVSFVAAFFRISRLPCLMAALFLVATNPTQALDNERLHSSKMEANVLDVESHGNLKTYTLTIENKNADAPIHYFMVGVPCGKVSEVSHSKNWPVRLEFMDKATGLYGMRFDAAGGYRLKPAEKMTVSFTISFAGEYCSNLMETWHPKIAYNFDSFIIKETIDADQKDIPEHIDFQSLQSRAIHETVEVSAYTNPEDLETTIEVVAKLDDQIKIEVFNTAGLKVSTLFIGQMDEGIPNLITFNSRIFPDKNYIFRLRSSEADLYGKLIFP